MADRKVILENCRIMFRNFAGKAGKFNRAGDRNFHVILPTKLAEEMQDDGWNVKWFQPKEPDDEPIAHLMVSLRFDNYPPRIFLISGKKKTRLDEESIEVLDQAEIENVDLVIRPYNWETADSSGVKAYVDCMYVTIVQDTFADKYRDYEGDDPFEEDDAPPFD